MESPDEDNFIEDIIIDNMNKIINKYVENFINEKIIRGTKKDYLKKNDVNEAYDEWYNSQELLQKYRAKESILHEKLAQKIGHKYRPYGWAGWKIFYD